MEKCLDQLVCNTQLCALANSIVLLYINFTQLAVDNTYNVEGYVEKFNKSTVLAKR